MQVAIETNPASFILQLGREAATLVAPLRQHGTQHKINFYWEIFGLTLGYLHLLRIAMIQSASLFDVLVMKVASWRSFLPHGLQRTIPSFTHASRSEIITAIRALHGQGYPHYVDGMELPAGVYAPMPGFFHADLLATVGDACSNVILRHGMDRQQVQEPLDKLQDQLRSTLESHGAEYQLGTFFQRRYKYRISRTNNLYVLAEEYRAIVHEMTFLFFSTDNPNTSSLEISGRDKLCVSAGNAMRDHILQLIAK